MSLFFGLAFPDMESRTGLVEVACERSLRACSLPPFKLLEDAFQTPQDFLHRGCFNRFNGVTTSVVKGLNNLGSEKEPL